MAAYTAGSTKVIFYALGNASAALVVLGISVALEVFSLHGALREIRKVANGKPFLKWFRETRQSELMVIAGEDIAALAGLGLAFAAVLLSVVSGNPLWDALGSIAVGVLLMIVALVITRELKAMVTGESADPEIGAAILAYIETQPQVVRAINFITLQWGAQLMVAVQARWARKAATGRWSRRSTRSKPGCGGNGRKRCGAFSSRILPAPKAATRSASKRCVPSAGNPGERDAILIYAAW